jgi:hypothetical protein
VNPVLTREIRERFRTRRAPWFVFAWTLVMGLVVYVIYLLAQMIARNQFGLGRLIATGYMGRFIFQATTLLLVTAVVMVIPGVSALAIVGERERQTFPLLQVSQLTPLQLVLGKLSSSVSYLLLLLMAVAPVAALPLLFGGLGVGDVLAALAIIVLTAVTVGSLSILVSARARSSRGAVAGSYLLAFVLAFFTLALMAGELLIFRRDNGEIFGPRGREVYSVWLNPYFAMVDAVDAPLTLRSDSFFSPYTPFEALIYRRQGVRIDALTGFVQGVEGGVVDRPLDPGGRVGGVQEIRMRRGSIWIRTVILYAVISALALLRAAMVVRAPAARTLRIRRARRAPS